MRIAQVSTLSTPVRQRGAGSVESLVWLMTRELMALGHEVTVFGAAGSHTDGETVMTLPGTYATAGAPDDWHLCEFMNLCRAVEQSHRFDVIHAHAYLWSIPLEPLSRAAMVHTTHVMPDANAAALRRWNRGACVTGLSAFQWSAYPDLPPTAVIPFGPDPSQFTFRAVPDDYVCFLGRFLPEKGPLAAIGTARALGVPIRLAGPRNDYYRAEIAPLVDGRMVEYVGPIGGAERDQFLGGAKALLYPLSAPEPFGLVQIEAMLCGTPAVVFRTGASLELIEDGVTGFGAESPADYPQKVLASFALDRVRIRSRALERFSPRASATALVALYQRTARVQQ